MTDIETARRVLSLAADDDGLSAEDLRVLRTELSLSEKQVTYLSRALSDRYVSPEERVQLTGPRLFSRAFVTALVGRDGMEPLRRRVDLLMDRAADGRLEPSIRAGALSQLRDTIYRAGTFPDQERWFRAAAVRIVDRMTPLVRNDPEGRVRLEALSVLTAMTAPFGPVSYLSRAATLRAMEALDEAVMDPEPGVRGAAVIAAANFYQAWPSDLPEGQAVPLEAWKGRCRPHLEAILRAGQTDADARVRREAGAILEVIFVGSG